MKQVARQRPQHQTPDASGLPFGFRRISSSVSLRRWSVLPTTGPRTSGQRCSGQKAGIKGGRATATHQGMGNKRPRDNGPGNRRSRFASRPLDHGVDETCWCDISWVRVRGSGYDTGCNERVGTTEQVTKNQAKMRVETEGRTILIIHLQLLHNPRFRC